MSADLLDANPGDGDCDADLGAAGDQCSLRAAIQEANAMAGQQTITLDALTYTLTREGATEDANLTGDLDITDDVEISGVSSTLSVVQAGTESQSGIDRVFHIHPGVNADLSQLTARNGATPDDEVGGGILNDGGILSLVAVYLSDSYSDRTGGGLQNQLGGQVTIEESLITRNYANQSNGGGVYMHDDGSSLTILYSQVNDNQASTNGGAIIAEGEPTTLTIMHSEVNGNVAGAASSSGNGGGIYVNDTDFTFSDSTLDNNSAAGNGGGIYTSGTTVALIERSTISNNTGGSDGAGDSGGIRNGGTAVTVINSTISGNQAARHGGGIRVFNNDTLNLFNSTVTDNTADFDADDDGDGGGINASESAIVNAKNSIIAGNFDPTSDPDCFGPITSQGFNVIEIVSANCLFNPLASDITGEDALLDPLSDNGGPTHTHRIDADSPAVNSGGDCPPPSTDQRGAHRPIGGVCDIGSFETGATPPTPTPAPTQPSTPTPTPTAPAGTPTPSATLSPSATPDGETPTPTPAATPSPTPTDGPQTNVDWADDDCNLTVAATDALKKLQDIASIPYNVEPGCPTLGDFVGVQPAGFGQLIWGDTDCDGDYDAVDALQILRHIAGLPPNQSQPCPDVGEPVLVN